MDFIIKLLGKIVGILGFIIMAIASIWLIAVGLVFLFPAFIGVLLLFAGVAMGCAWDIENFKANLKKKKEDMISENKE